MAYRVFLVDETDGSNVELDTENVSFETTFSVADVSDIEGRKDTITKTILFKGSAQNNSAFGSLFHLNRVHDSTVTNKLFFNYNPLRTVKCLVYEDSILLINGSLRVMEINVDKNNFITYSTVVTGSLISFKDVVGDKLLTDLVIDDLEHVYNWTNIKASWSGDYTQSFVYPTIDYGYIFEGEINPKNGDQNEVHISNYKPALYVREYFDRIFEQPALAGYTYEYVASPAAVSKFNKMIVPFNGEKLFNKSATLLKTKVYRTSGFLFINNTFDAFGSTYFSRAIPLPYGLNLDTTQNLFEHYGTYQASPNALVQCSRTFTSNAYVKVETTGLFNDYGDAKRFAIQLVERDHVDSADSEFNSVTDMKVVAQQQIVIAGAGSASHTFEFEVGEREYVAGKQLAVRLHVDQGSFDTSDDEVDFKMFYTIGNAELKFTKDDDSVITYEVKPGNDIIPRLPEGIKQIDFIKGIMTTLNWYTYVEKSNPRKIYFMSYDDFYALSQPQLLAANAINWTDKIDYNGGFKIKSNLQIPKKYLFSWKEDKDFLNDSYKKSFNDVYGSFRFNDAYGVTAEKKVEVVFSGTVPTQYVGTGRVHPAIYTVESNNKKVYKSNIRLLYFNGSRTCIGYAVSDDADDYASNQTTYGQCGTYLLEPFTMVPTDDLNFGLPKQLYFDFLPEHQTVPNLYTNYIGQISHLTNPNVSIIECEVYLNSLDMDSFNLKTPIYIDLGDLGHSYFRVLNVEYTNKDSTSRVTLQKIVV